VKTQMPLTLWHHSFALCDQPGPAAEAAEAGFTQPQCIVKRSRQAGNEQIAVRGSETGEASRSASITTSEAPERV
jgi:hypothetical protein